MAELEEYEIEVGGITHTVQLSPDDVERYGEAAKRVERKAAQPSNKSAQPANK